MNAPFFRSLVSITFLTVAAGFTASTAQTTGLLGSRSTVYNFGYPKKVVVQGNMAYTIDDFGYSVYDIANPANIIYKGYNDLPLEDGEYWWDEPTDIAVDSCFLYFGGRNFEGIVYKINTATPYQLPTIFARTPYSNDLDFESRHFYGIVKRDNAKWLLTPNTVQSWDTTTYLYKLNITTIPSTHFTTEIWGKDDPWVLYKRPALPKAAATTQSWHGCYANDRIYTLKYVWNDAMQIWLLKFRIEKICNFYNNGKCEVITQKVYEKDMTNDNTVGSLAVSGNYLYMVNRSSNTLNVYNIAGDNLKYVSQMQIDGINGDFVISDTRLIYPAPNGLQVVDISNPAKLENMVKYAWPSAEVGGISIALKNDTVVATSNTGTATGSFIAVYRLPSCWKLQAESAVMVGAKCNNTAAGFSSTGYADYVNASNDYIEWTFDAPSTDMYAIDFRYSLTGTNRPLQVKVNGTVVADSFAFPVTGSWSTWKYTNQLLVKLNAGTNKIRTTAIGLSGGNIDLLRIAKSNAKVVQAENAVLNGAKVSTSSAGYTGTGYADYVNNSNDWVEWTYTAPKAGTYAIDFRYACVGANRPLQIKVNGAVASGSFAFPATASWSTWKFTSVLLINLNAGTNKIRATAIGYNGGNIDYLRVRSAPDQSTLPKVIAESDGDRFSNVIATGLHAPTATMKVYSLSGRLVATAEGNTADLSKGNFKHQNIARGNYLYVLKDAAGNVMKGKMALQGATR